MHPAGMISDWPGYPIHGLFGPKVHVAAPKPRRRRSFAGWGALISGVTALAFGVLSATGCQPVPCEQQGNRPRVAAEPALAATWTAGDCTQAQAVQNRLSLESPAPLVPPNVTIKLDRAFQPVSGTTIDGNGSTIQNSFDPTTRTIQARGTGLGYFSSGKVVGPNAFMLADPNEAVYFKSGQPVYLWRLDGFQNPDGVGGLRTLHGIKSVVGATINLVPGGAPLDPRINSAKWFSNAVYVGDVKAGLQQFVLPTSIYKTGDWVQITEGPSLANEGRSEWHRVVSTPIATFQLLRNAPPMFSKVTAATSGINIEEPVQRNYSAAVLAQATPVTSVTLKNLTVELPADKTSWSTQINYGHSWRLDNCVIKGTWSQVASQFVTMTNCTIDNLSLNSCAHFQFINCQFGTVWLEEGTFDVTFSGCVFQKTFSGNTGIERINLRACRLLAGPGNFIGLQAPGSTYDALTLDATAYIGGDGVTIRNCRGSIVLGQGGGLVVDSPNAKVNGGKWVVIP